MNKLYKNELVDKFKYKKKVRFDDFKNFYRRYDSSISEKTIRKYIYDLNEAEIINRVGWGVYQINKEHVSAQLKEETQYMVMTLDIINSKETPNEIFTETLEKKVAKINDILASFLEYKRKFYKSHGDELQIICPVTSRVSYLIFFTLYYLRPYTARYGISVGTVEGELLENSWEMNGEIFWSAREALDTIKTKKEYFGAIFCADNLSETAANDLLEHVNLLFTSWTDKQWEAIYYKIKYENTKIISDKLGISEPGVNKRLKPTNYKLALKSIETIAKLLKRTMED